MESNVRARRTFSTTLATVFYLVAIFPLTTGSGSSARLLLPIAQAEEAEMTFILHLSFFGDTDHLSKEEQKKIDRFFQNISRLGEITEVKTISWTDDKATSSEIATHRNARLAQLILPFYPSSKIERFTFAKKQSEEELPLMASVGEEDTYSHLTSSSDKASSTVMVVVEKRE